ncbi:MerR family transcriptional regulator [Pelomonas sp. HMWF004]|nr:MerR family transcriptional regulator [Pelomonas sp. HMWF004]
MADFSLVPTAPVVVEAHVSFTLVALCRASGADPGQVHDLVSEGVLQPAGQGTDTWQFGGDALPQTRRALRLARDLELSLSGVALVLDLLAEIERLESRLRRR